MQSQRESFSSFKLLQRYLTLPANSTIQQNLIPNEVDLADCLNLHKKDVFLNLNCHHIGTIQTFNSTLQTASVTINYSKTYFQFNSTTGAYDNMLVNYPVIAEAPVVCLGGGMTSLTFPIQTGDECLVLFNDRDFDNWFTGGSGSPNATARLHSFADALVIVGIRSMANVITNYSADHAVLQNGTTLVGVGPTTIKIANAGTTLNTLLQSLISDLQSLVTQTAAITVSSFGAPPNNAAAIAAIGTQLGTLGTQIGQLLE